MSDTLNAEILENARRSLAAMASSARVIVGLSMSPAVKAKLLQELPLPKEPRYHFFIMPFGVPIIVDPRMTSRSATVFYDRKIWRKRVKEQRRWDRRQSRQNVSDHSPIGAVSASNPESNSTAPIG